VTDVSIGEEDLVFYLFDTDPVFDPENLGDYLFDDDDGPNLFPRPNSEDDPLENGQYRLVVAPYFGDGPSTYTIGMNGVTLGWGADRHARG
jgi:hypothetical protein